MRVPTMQEARYLRQLSQGMLPTGDFPRSVYRSLCREGWMYAARHGHGETWMALNDEGAMALRRYEEE